MASQGIQCRIRKSPPVGRKAVQITENVGRIKF